jgi:2-deoxy-D-gluconate 3-dehydrogenase
MSTVNNLSGCDGDDRPFFLAQAFARVLVQDDRGGSIINMASLNSFQGGIEVPAYTASKHWLLGVTRAMANELSRKGIRVNAIAPGYMSTQFTAAHREDPARYDAMIAQMPMVGTLTASRPECPAEYRFIGCPARDPQRRTVR